MEERYFAETLDRTPATDPGLVLETLHDIWISTLYGPAGRR